MEQFLHRSRSNLIGMRIRDLTERQLSSVLCPFCGVSPGQRCLLHSGGLRNEPHTDRKLAAIEAVEKERDSAKRRASRITSPQRQTR
jgi:hypothetical protein